MWYRFEVSAFIGWVILCLGCVVQVLDRAASSCLESSFSPTALALKEAATFAQFMERAIWLFHFERNSHIAHIIDVGDFLKSLHVTFFDDFSKVIQFFLDYVDDAGERNGHIRHS